MRVIATKLGFYKGRRINPGEEFDFDMRIADHEIKVDENGKRVYEENPLDPTGPKIPVLDMSKPVLPTWMIPATPKSRAEFEDAQKNAAKKARAAALAAAGPKRPQRGFASAPGAEDFTGAVTPGTDTGEDLA